MKLLNTLDTDFDAQLARLLDRDTPEDRAIEAAVRDIIDAVRDRGNEALMEYSRKFDRLQVSEAEALEISADQLETAYNELDPAVHHA